MQVVKERVKFHKERKRGSFLDPRKGFAATVAESEVRFDPLTGATARICHFSLDKAPPIDLSASVEATKQGCPFCPERVLEVTPKFEPELVPEGRVQRGEAVVFPNLFPYDDHSAIAVVSHDHGLPMGDMPEGTLIDALGASCDFLRRIDARNNGSAVESHPIITWNFMPPAGGSQLHPHLQVIHTTHPANGMRRRLQAEAAWRARSGSTFAADLIDAERASGERWIGDSGEIAWIAPFQPTGMLGDCMAYFPGRSAVTQLNDEDLAQFEAGLRRVLKGFAELGFVSFNLVLAGGPSGDRSGAHWVSASVVPRFYVNPGTHACDVAYMQLCLDENFAMVYPEDTAAKLRAFWS